MTTEFLKPKTTVNISLAVPVIVDPGGRVLYANNGTSWGSDWFTGYTANGSGVTSVARTAIGGRLWMTASGTTAVNPTAEAYAWRVISGLTIGRSYTLTARISNAHSSATRTRVQIDGNTSAWVIGTSDAPVSVTFTPTLTTTTLTLLVSDNPASSSAQSLIQMQADDILLVENDLTSDELELEAEDCTIKLDISRIPYVQADVQIPLLSDELIEHLNPEDGIRVLLTVEDPEAGTSREFNLVLRSRPVTYQDRSLILRLASDEALLQDWAPLTTVSTRGQEVNLAFLINEYVLINLDTALWDDTTTADLTAYWPITNLFPNPASEHATEFAWVPGTGAPVITRSSTQAYQGTYSVRMAAAGSGDANANGGKYTAKPGERYTFQTHLRSSVSRSAQLLLRFFNADGNVVRNATSTSTATSTGSWQEREVSAVAPATAATFTPFVLTTGNASGNFHYLDATLLYEGDPGEAYFSGTTSNTAHYLYSWQDDTNASASERTPVVERSPELFTWEPGVTAWEFLQPLLSAAELRLICDENRRWALIESDYEVDATVIDLVGATNVWQASDDIDLDARLSCTGVVVRYAWTDRYGIDRVKYDTAGVEGRVIRRDYDKPYPGPGAAQYLLNQYRFRGRQQTVRALLDLNATPTQNVHIELPGAVAQNGFIQAVTFDLSAGLMTVETINLTATL